MSNDAAACRFCNVLTERKRFATNVGEQRHPRTSCKQLAGYTAPAQRNTGAGNISTQINLKEGLTPAIHRRILTIEGEGRAPLFSS
jgi:hypothetical protein